jgi:hypothetical protein
MPASNARWALPLIAVLACACSSSNSPTPAAGNDGYPPVDTSQRVDFHIQGTVAGVAVDVRVPASGGMFANGGSFDFPNNLASDDGGVSATETAVHLTWNALVPDGSSAPVQGTVHVPVTAASGEITLCAGDGSFLYIPRTASSDLFILDFSFVNMKRGPDCTQAVAGELKGSFSSNFAIP